MIALLLFMGLCCPPLGAATPSHQNTAEAPRPQQAPASRTLLLDASLAGARIVAVGERGAIILSNDSGRSWANASCPAGPTLTGLAFANDARRGWAVGHGARILSTTDGGANWTSAYTHTDTDASLLDVAVLGADHIMAIGAFGLALESRDGGKTWNSVSLPSGDRHLNRIIHTSRETTWIVGESGVLLRSNNQGDSWDSLPSPYEGSLYGLTQLRSGELIAHGLRGSLFIADALSAPSDIPVWRRLSSQAKGLLATSLASSQGTLFVAGQARMTFTSKDGGRTWDSWTAAPTTAIAELLEAPDGAVLCFGEAGVSVIPAH